MFSPDSSSSSLVRICSRMSTTTMKHRDFVGEPMGDKSVSSLSGIGHILGKTLEQQGFDKVQETHQVVQKTLKCPQRVFRVFWCVVCISCVYFACFLCVFHVYSVCFQAYMVLGQFLLLKKDTEMFTKWLKDASGANSHQAGSCAQCLREWCDTFL